MPSPTSAEKMQLRLFIVGGAPNSITARANLTAILSGVSRDEYTLEIVDCIAEPHRALAEGVLVTPTLLKTSPAPARTVIGSLADRRAVVAALGLEAPDTAGNA
jgi:circadian clock protein KaiB